MTTLLPKQTLKKLQNHTRELPEKGIVVCAGVYGGGDIKAMAEVRHDLRFIAIDSWQGLGEPSADDLPSASRGKFAYSFDKFLENVQGLHVVTFPMWINKANINFVDIAKVDMLWIDLDQAKPTEVILDYFLPKCTASAPVLVHDYKSANYPGVKKVCDKYGKWQDLGHTLARLIK